MRVRPGRRRLSSLTSSKSVNASGVHLNIPGYDLRASRWYPWHTRFVELGRRDVAVGTEKASWPRKLTPRLRNVETSRRK